jgi:hypothetical protein
MRHALAVCYAYVIYVSTFDLLELAHDYNSNVPHVRGLSVTDAIR